ncbi:MAG: hypothetical protein WDO73_32235 [Ignavibacteriota bacterium]
MTALSVGREGLSPRRRKKLVWPWVAIGAATRRRHSADDGLACCVATFRPAGHNRDGSGARRTRAIGPPTRRESNSIRGDGGTESRAPRSSGSVVSVEDGMATVDLGSLDGLAKGGTGRRDSQWTACCVDWTGDDLP